MTARTVATALSVLIASAACLALSPQQSKKIAVKPGVTSTVNGTLKGRGYADYLVNVGAGQALSVALLSKSTSAYFNVIGPRQQEAMFIGSFGTNYTGDRIVPIDGIHTVRVYQMGGAASSGKTTSYALHIKVSGKAIPARSFANDAKIKGTPFHAMAPVDCRINIEPARKTCDAYVIRRGSGNGTVEIHYGQTVRRVLFVNGKPVGHDSAFGFEFHKTGDDTTLWFGLDRAEEFKIPDMLIYGG